MVSQYHGPCSGPAQVQGVKIHGRQLQKLQWLKNPCFTGASISYNNSVGTASRVPAMDMPVMRVTPFREDQGTVSWSVIYSSLIVLPAQTQLTNWESFYHRQHDLVTCWHILSLSVSRETGLGVN